MKYRLVGWLDFVLGGLGFVLQVIMLFVVYPRMNVLYENFGADLPLSTKMYPYTTGVAILVLAGVTWVGWKLAFTKNPSNKLFKFGIVAMIVMILGVGYFLATSMLSLIYPIYSVTSNL